MGYEYATYLSLVLLWFVTVTDAGGGSRGEDIHFKINVPTFIKKIKHTKTVFVHKGGGGGGGGHVGGGDHKLPVPMPVEGHIIGHGHHHGGGGGGGGGGGHSSYTLHNSFLHHGGHTASGAVHGNGGFGLGHEMMSSAYTSPMEGNIPGPTHSGLMAHPPPPVPVHEDFNELPTGFGGSGPQAAHLHGHAPPAGFEVSHYTSPGMPDFGAARLATGQGGASHTSVPPLGNPPPTGAARENAPLTTYPPIADRPSEFEEDAFNYQYEGSGFGDVGTNAPPIPGFKPLPNTLNGHANAPYVSVVPQGPSFQTENNNYDHDLSPTYHSKRSPGHKSFGNHGRINMVRKQSKPHFRRHRNKKNAPPFPSQQIPPLPPPQHPPPQFPHQNAPPEHQPSFPPQNSPPFPPENIPPEHQPSFPPHNSPPFPPQDSPPEYQPSFPPHNSPPFPPQDSLPFPPQNSLPFPPQNSPPFPPQHPPSLPPQHQPLFPPQHAPPIHVKHNRRPPPNYHKPMYSSYEQMVEKVVENLFSGKNRGLHSHPSYSRPHSYPHRRQYIELEEVVPPHKTRSGASYKGGHKKKASEKHKHSKGILVNLVKARLEE